MKRFTVFFLLLVAAASGNCGDRGKFSATYSAQVNGLTMALLATDVFELVGSSTRTVRVTRVAISGTQTTAGVQICSIFKNTSADSGGTFTVQAPTAYDSFSEAPGATAKSYTANPTVGNRAGRILQRRILIPTVIGATDASEHVLFEATRPAQPITLRGPDETLVVNMGGITLVGGVLSIYVEWTEEDS